MSPTQRTIAELKKRGYLCHIVEKWNPFAKIRQDFGGFADILAYRNNVAGVLAIQTTSDSNVSARVAKSLQISNLATWLRAGNTFQVWGWGKKGERGKRKLWTLRAIPLLWNGEKVFA